MRYGKLGDADNVSAVGNVPVASDTAGKWAWGAGTSVGRIIQVVNTQTGAVATGTTLLPYDDTIPQNTEGDEYMTLAITPTNASNKLKIDVVCVYASDVNTEHNCVALFQDTTAGALACVIQSDSLGNYEKTLSFSHYMVAGTSSSTTFKVRAGASAKSTAFTFNGKVGNRRYGGVLASSITITEIAA